MALFVAALVVLFILKVIDVLLLVFLAILLAVYLSAVTDWLERRFGMRRWLGLTLTVVATIAGVASVAALLAPPVVEQTRALIAKFAARIAHRDMLGGLRRKWPAWVCLVNHSPHDAAICLCDHGVPTNKHASCRAGSFAPG